MKSMARSGHSEPCLVVLGLSLRVEIPKTHWTALSSLVPTLTQSTSHPLAQAAREDIKQYWPWQQLLGSIARSSQMDLGLLRTALGLCWSGRFSTHFTVSFFKLYSTSLAVRTLWEILLKALVVSKQSAVPLFRGPIISKMRCVRCGWSSIATCHFPSPFSSSSTCRWFL